MARRKSSSRKSAQFGLAKTGTSSVVGGLQAIGLVAASAYVLRALQLAYHVTKNGAGPIHAQGRGITNPNSVGEWFKFFLMNPASNVKGIEGRGT